MLPRLNTGKSRSDWYKSNKPKPIAENAMEDPDKKTWGFTIQTDRDGTFGREIFGRRTIDRQIF